MNFFSLMKRFGKNEEEEKEEESSSKKKGARGEFLLNLEETPWAKKNYFYNNCYRFKNIRYG